MNFELHYKKLVPDAQGPSKAHPSDLGFDLFAKEDVIIPAYGRAIIGTGIGVRFPENIGGILKDRSGNAAKLGLHVLAGVIDPNYTGEIGVVFFNTNRAPVKISKGDKIAQMLLMPVFQVTGLYETTDLGDTDRGDKGFGSSG
jgi:dUTP pyrophosphatase